MRVPKLLSHKHPTLVMLTAIVLALPAMPGRSMPCDMDPVAAPPASHWDIPVLLATDLAWQEAYGGRGDTMARQLIDDVNDIMAPTGVRLVVAGHIAWEGNEGGESMPELLRHLEASVPAPPGQLVIGLTGRQLSRVDGLAGVGQAHLVARLHPNNPQSDGAVVAHEIGHVLGAKHHSCCHEFVCVMAPKGSLQPTHWCTSHLLQVQIGAARLLGEPAGGSHVAGAPARTSGWLSSPSGPQ